MFEKGDCRSSSIKPKAPRKAVCLQPNLMCRNFRYARWQGCTAGCICTIRLALYILNNPVYSLIPIAVHRLGRNFFVICIHMVLRPFRTCRRVTAIKPIASHFVSLHDFLIRAVARSAPHTRIKSANLHIIRKLFKPTVCSKSNLPEEFVLDVVISITVPIVVPKSVLMRR